MYKGRASSAWKQEELEEAGTKCSHLPGAQNLEQESLVQSQLGTQQDPLSHAFLCYGLRWLISVVI